LAGARVEWEVAAVVYPFARFTENAKQVLTLAQDEAEKSHHSYIGTEHLLLGLLRETEGRASKLLTLLGVDVQQVRATIDSVLGRNERISVQQIIPTSRVKKVIELAFDEAKGMGDFHVGTAHLLLGLIRDGEGIAAHVLQDLDIDAARVLANLSDDEEDHGSDASPREPGGHSVRATFRNISTGAGPSPVGYLGELSQFTSEAKSALALAEEEAVKAGAGYIGTEHVLAGLVRQAEGTAGRLLLSRGVTLEKVRQELAKNHPPPPRLSVPAVLLTNELQNALLRSRREARGGLTAWVDTQHLLLAIIAEAAEPAVQLLTALGVDAARIREEIKGFESDSSA